MSDNRAASKEPTARLDELKGQIERASALIGELRETNYSLTTELVELKNRLATGENDRETSPPPASGRAPAASGEDGSASHAGELAQQVELLRSERETVRKKLKSLIARIEKLES